MTDEALELYETNELADKAEAYDKLRQRAGERGFASVNDLIDAYDAMQDDR